MKQSAPAAPKVGTAGIIPTPGGGQVYYEDSGGPGPVLFYVYGLACSVAHWKYQLAHFAAPAPDRPWAYRQIWMDFRGHGKSPPPAPGVSCTMADVVTDIVAVCAECAVDAIHVLGQSLGGSIALQLACDYPKLVRSLVLLASPSRDPSRDFPLQPWSRWLWQAITRYHRAQQLPLARQSGTTLNRLFLTQPWLFAALRETVRAKGFNSSLAKTEDITEYVYKFLEVDPRLFSAMAADLVAFDACRFAHQVTCPTLLIAGAGDQIIPLKDSRRLLRHLPRGKLAVVPHGSHCPHFDDPVTVNALIAEFLVSVSVPAAPRATGPNY